MYYFFFFFFFKQKTAYERRPRDWSSDVCSSDPMCMKLNLITDIIAYVKAGLPKELQDRDAMEQVEDVRTGMQKLKHELVSSKTMFRQDVVDDWEEVLCDEMAYKDASCSTCIHLVMKHKSVRMQNLNKRTGEVDTEEKKAARTQSRKDKTAAWSALQDHIVGGECDDDLSVTREFGEGWQIGRAHV